MDYLLNIGTITIACVDDNVVLNLIINGLPSKLNLSNINWTSFVVLNLIINGLPSKRK